MSHFSVLVITDQEPTDDVLSKTLLPFHEYECTGIEEYLEDVDVTDNILKHYNEPVKVVILADGSYHSRWDGKFYTKKPSEDSAFARNEFELPAGAREEEISAAEARKHKVGYESVKEAAEAYYGNGVFEREGRWFRRTNPNAKWDWWVRGGRFRGMLQVKEGSMAYEGRPGVFGNGPARTDGVDSCRVRDLDLESMRNEAASKAAEAWDTVHEVVDGRTWETWDEVRAKFEKEGGDATDYDAARDYYHKQPVIKDIHNNKAASNAAGWDRDSFRMPREEYIQRARDRACQTFAVLKDGKWYEKGKMGWWAIVTDENPDWDKEFGKLLDGLPPETWLTVVDCHI